MPRRAQPVTIDQPGINDALVREDLAKVDRRNQQLARIDERFADGMPYERNRLIGETRFYMRQSAESLLEVGKRLILLKEHEPHGDFLQALDAISVEPRFAQKCMQAALKFVRSNAPSTAHLAGLGTGRLLELLVLDDAQVDELAEGGTVAGLSLDQVERMSTRELREALRKEKAERDRDRQVHERVVKTKNDKIDDYEKKLARRETGAPAARHQALTEELWLAVMEVGQPLLRIEQIFADIAALEHSENIPGSLANARGQVLAFLVQQLIEMQQRNAIEADLETVITPPWMKGGE